MKKIIAMLLLLGVTAFGLTACNNEINYTSSKNESSNVSSERKDNINSQFMPNVDEIQSDVNANTAAKAKKLSTEKIGWGQGTQTDKNNRPVSCDSFNDKYGDLGGIFVGGQEKKKIYLTFDEGYENGYTEKILDVLKEKNVSAVFFITRDYISGNEDIIKRMVSEGHILGNHSWTHPSMPTLSETEVKNEITKLHDYVKRQFGVEMTLFRPPMGEFSEKSLSITQSCGYKSVFWSFAYKDWVTDSQPDNATALKKIVNCLHPGAIYLLHAVSKTNTEILGDFIDTAREKGYEFSKFDL